MSQPDFDKAAFELVTEFGGPGTYVKATIGDYDPATATSEETTVEIPLLVALIDLTRPNNGLGTKPGSNEIVQADKEAYVVPPTKRGNASLLPIDTVNDNIVVNGVSYSIVTMKEINPSGSDPLLYIFYLRY
jgi:hypothetical protein